MSQVSAARRASEWERDFREQAQAGNSPDALRRYCTDEVERFWSRVIEGPDGHQFWEGSPEFVRNDGRTRHPRRWIWKREHGGELSRWVSVLPTCGEANCIALAHQTLVIRRQSKRRYSDSEIVDTLRKTAARLGRSPRRDDWREMHLRPDVTIIYQRFGAWNEFLSLAGLALIPHGPAQTYSDDNLIRGLRELAELLGHPPTSKDWDRHRDWVRANGYASNSKTVRRRLAGGSWVKSLERAGLREPKRTRTRHARGTKRKGQG